MRESNMFRFFVKFVSFVVLGGTMHGFPVTALANPITLTFATNVWSEWNYDAGKEKGFQWQNVIEPRYGTDDFVQGHYDVYERDDDLLGSFVFLNTDYEECRVLDERGATVEYLRGIDGHQCGTAVRINRISTRPFNVLSVVISCCGVGFGSSKGGSIDTFGLTDPFTLVELSGEEWKGVSSVSFGGVGGIALLTVEEVPEPSTLLLLASATVAFAAFRRRVRGAKAAIGTQGRGPSAARV